MRVYQCYGLNSENEVVSALDVLCVDDDGAVEVAATRLEGFAIVEVWDAGRRVERREAGGLAAG